MAGGRPTKYRKKYCQEIIKFFDREPWTIEERPVVNKKTGEVHMVKIKVPCRFPTFEKFALTIDVCIDTLNEWTRRHPEFSDAYKKAKKYQKDIIIENGLVGLWDKAYVIFLSKNVTDMRDNKVLDLKSSDGSMSPNLSKDQKRKIAKRYLDKKDE